MSKGLNAVLPDARICLTSQPLATLLQKRLPPDSRHGAVRPSLPTLVVKSKALKVSEEVTDKLIANGAHDLLISKAMALFKLKAIDTILR